jgi:putative Holliday junction resolvase
MASAKRSIGIDLGGARCGVAVDDELGQLAHPRPNLPAKDRKALVEALAGLAREVDARRFVIGLPLEMTGEEGRAAERVRTFAQHLADASGLEVVLWDERLSTVEAAAALRRAGHDARGSKDLIDGAAAVTILQSWLDARRARRAAKKGEPA